MDQENRRPNKASNFEWYKLETENQLDKCDEKDLTYTRILNNNNNQYTDLFSVYIAES